MEHEGVGRQLNPLQCAMFEVEFSEVGEGRGTPSSGGKRIESFHLVQAIRSPGGRIGIP